MPHFSTRLALFIVLCLVTFSCRQKSQPEGFLIEPGFTLSLVAAEPLLKDPVDLEFNELGDALVLEMPGYPFEDKQSRIVVLKDSDDDGQYDESIVFLENLQLANSFMPYKKGVLVAAPPYLLFVHDENQDYRPEKVDTLMGGFATGNLQHNYNSLTLGLDNWIYAANGGNDGAPYWWNDTTTRMDLRGQDFRFNLETKKLERLGQSSGGFGLAMDEYGRLFETHNLTHLSHLVFPDRYLRGKKLLKESTLENISDHEESGLARIYPIGEQESRVNHPEQSGYFSGACGVTYYGGGAFGEAYNNTVWAADVVLNLIHVDKITPSGSSFVASRVLDQRDFLASTDRAFRPVNMAVGPDGAMYVVDMYRKVIEHPEWIPDDIEKTLDLAAGKDQGRIYRIEKAETKGSFDVSLFATPQGLVECLSHPNQWVRKTAHRLLLDLPITSETTNLLTSQLSSPNEFVRLHALWLLQVRAGLSDTALANALNDSIPAIRESALQMAESRLGTNPELLTLCLSLMNDVDARVKMQAALSVSTLTAEQFEANREQVLKAVWMAAQQPGDAWNAAALTLAANSSAATLLVKLLADWQGETLSSELLMSLAQASGNRASGNRASGIRAPGTREGTQSVLSALASTKVPGHVRQKIVLQLIDGMDISDSKSIEQLIRPLEQSGDAGMISALALMRNKLELPPSAGFLKLSREALNKVVDKSLPDSARIGQLAVIELLPYKEKSEVLFSCLHHAEPLKLQENALRQLSKYNEKEIGHKVVEMWNELSPHTRRYASDLLLYIETHHDALLTGLEDGTINIGEMNFDLERRRTLLWWTDNEDTKRRAEKLFTDSGVANRQEAVGNMRPALGLKGTAANGAKVFETVCSTCHVYGALGKEVGPILTEIGRKSKETLLHDILDPNAAADPKYINHRLETADGMVHLGIVAAETDKDITIKKIGGEKVTVSKSDIKGFRSLGTSLMMEGLENSMTPQEMADLLTFLQIGNQGGR